MLESILVYSIIALAVAAGIGNATSKSGVGPCD